MQLKKHKVPFKLRFHMAKDTTRLRILDILISWIKPPKRYTGTPGKILFMRNDRIGDAIVTLPVLRDLKLNYPEIQIHILASRRNRFIFDDLEFVDKVVEFAPKFARQEAKGIFKIFLIGDLLQTLFVFILPYFFNPEFKKEIRILKQEKYDAAVDLSGEKFNLILSRFTAKYTVGSWVFGLFWLYSYYLRTNWVSHHDKYFMTRKIESCLKDAFGFKFEQMKKEMPLAKRSFQGGKGKDTDIMIHLGGTELRKLASQVEEDLIGKLAEKKLLITDSSATQRFNHYKSKYNGHHTIQFRLYEHLSDVAVDAKASKLLISYDGGQALYLSQFVRTIAIYGPGSVHLWKPYEFEDYTMIKEWDNGVRAIQSNGKLKHIAIYYPIWCSPCYEIGCETRPCLNSIKAEYIAEMVNRAINSKT